MKYKQVLYEEEDGIATITMNRPEVLNAITPAMLAELKEAVEEAASSPNVRIITLTGAGRAFCAGVDLKALGEVKLEGGKVGAILDNPARELIEAIRSVPKPVIALVNGPCFTGALEIVLACDLVIASEDAKIGDTHAKWGLRPTWGMSARLPRRCGFLKAKELSFTADSITGREAERIGLVNMAVPAEKLKEVLVTVASKIMANSPWSVAAYKRLYNNNESMTLEDALQLEFASEFEIPDTAERIKGFKK